jgi:heat shock protein HtpX
MFKHTFTTFMLLAGLGTLFVSCGYLLGGASGMTIALIMALVINTITLFFGDSIVLTIMSAQPLERETHSKIYDMTADLCHEMQIPLPRLWLLPSQTANAFATGRSPAHSSVAISTGLLTILESHEVRGVIAHELSHIKNRDILVATSAATLATAISYLGHMTQRMFFWQALSGNNRNRQGNIVGVLVSAIVMPLAAMIVQLGISRSREYLADETGAHYSHDPLALASALEKLHNHTQHGFAQENATATTSISSLFIVHPFSASSVMELFSTHPPIHKRVARLRALYEKRF